MKQFIFFTFLFVTQNVFGVNYQTGDSLYVWADSGLRMRSEPSLKGAKITLIPYGEKIKVIQQEVKIHPFKVNELKLKPTDEKAKLQTFDIDGFWVEIIWNGEKGYVFDGYLSSIETLNIDSLTGVPESFNNYLTRTSFLKREVKERLPNSDYFRDSLHFSNGINIFNGGSTGWGEEEIVIPNCTLVEGYLIANKLFGLKNYGKNETEGDFYYEFNSSELLFGWDYGGSAEILIKKIENKVIIKSYGNC